jgi:hypothetical protein
MTVAHKCFPAACVLVGWLQYFGSLHGITIQRSDGLPSPERSGSPELTARSSQW